MNVHEYRTSSGKAQREFAWSYRRDRGSELILVLFTERPGQSCGMRTKKSLNILSRTMGKFEGMKRKPSIDRLILIVQDEHVLSVAAVSAKAQQRLSMINGVGGWDMSGET